MTAPTLIENREQLETTVRQIVRMPIAISLTLAVRACGRAAARRVLS
jgi:hypothetical protein